MRKSYLKSKAESLSSAPSILRRKGFKTQDVQSYTPSRLDVQEDIKVRVAQSKRKLLGSPLKETETAS